MKIKEDIMTAVLVALATVLIYAFYMSTAHADRYDHHYQAPDVTYITEVYETYETYEVTEVINATEQQINDAIMNTSTIPTQYTQDECQGIAIAQAGANNQMYIGTKHPQLSLGLGECDGELASSLMFGMRINNQLMLNGSWAADESVNAFGVGATVIFK